MTDVYLHCRFQYNEAMIVYKHESETAPQNDADFVTGLITDSVYINGERYDYGTANGTTLSAALVTDDKVLDVGSTTGMTALERISVELDNGLRHVSFVESIDSGTQVTIADGVPSAAAIGNNVVTASQLDTTTDGSIAEDFKLKKAIEINDKSLVLLDKGYEFNGHRFNLVGDSKPEIRSTALYASVINDRTSAALTVTGITLGTETIISVSAIEDVKLFDTITPSGIVGTTELNNNHYTIGKIDGTDITIKNLNQGTDVDSSAYTAYTSGGTLTKEDAGAYQSILDVDGHTYELADNDEYADLAFTQVRRRNAIFGVGAVLLNSVSNAANTQAAMDAITDSRT